MGKHLPNWQYYLVSPVTVRHPISLWPLKIEPCTPTSINRGIFKQTKGFALKALAGDFETAQREGEMAAANRKLGNYRSRRIPLVGMSEGEMIMSATGMFRQF